MTNQVKNTFVEMNKEGRICPIQTASGERRWYETSVPCRTACPAGTDVPGYLKAIREGDFDSAYRINLRDNVFPAVLGRICTRPCEPACRHGRPGLGESVAICFSKRAAADFKANHHPVSLEPMFPASGKRVAIVGAGPGGLTAARELALFGHHVCVFEKHDTPGGMLVQGIPEFRLPRDIVSIEIEQILMLGIELKCGVEIGTTVTLGELRDAYDAVVLSSGAHLPWKPDVAGTDLGGVHHGFDFIRAVNHGEPPSIGSSVVIVGGGFTAIDCAQVSRYLGADDVELVYRRDQSKMRCTLGEIERMREEGITLRMNAVPIGYQGEREVRSVELQSTTGKTRTWRRETETVLIATGQRRSFATLDPEMGPQLDAAVKANPKSHRLASEPIFACGDARLGAQSIIDAIGDAKTCARAIDEHLMRENRFTDALVIKDLEETGRDRAFNQTPRNEERERPMEERELNAELSAGLDEDAAQAEAWRCYMCNQNVEIDTERCISCGLCLMVMPVEDCIVQLKTTNDGHTLKRLSTVHDFESYDALAVDQDRCIRCDACRESCPVNCISLQSATPVTRPEKSPGDKTPTAGTLPPGGGSRCSEVPGADSTATKKAKDTS